MNSLNKDLEQGDKVVMQGDCAVDDRTVIVKDGFGMSSSTDGVTLFVTTINGQYLKVNSMEIEKLIEE